MNLYDRCGPAIWRYTRARTRDDAEASDVIVAAFGEAAQSPSFFDGSISALTRILLIVHANT
jgi:DNA-directed RNA polymerase specialized sigma24 family protein